MEAFVCKFGGTSVADANQIRKIEKIIRSDSRRRYIVVSAPGKRNPSDEKITDLLYRCHDLSFQGSEFSSIWSSVRARYLEIASDLGKTLPNVAESLLGKIEQHFREGVSRDYIASRGEYLAARMIAAYLRATFVETEDAITIREDGQVAESSYAILNQKLQKAGLYVIPGFYGRDVNGQIRTFSRGGSDITGAVVSRAIQAQLYENWTDVSGCLATDPRIVPEARSIRTITYREMRALSLRGANVLHNESIYPVLPLGIPINIRNTNKPSDPGTLVVPELKREQGTITGIAGKRGHTLVLAEKPHTHTKIDALGELSEILEKLGVKVCQLLTGPDSVTLLCEAQQLRKQIQSVLDAVRSSLNTQSVKVIQDLAVVTVVGEGLADRIGVINKITEALAKRMVNLRLVEAGTSELCATLVVDNKDLETAIREIYRTISEDTDGR